MTIQNKRNSEKKPFNFSRIFSVSKIMEILSGAIYASFAVLLREGYGRTKGEGE